MIHPHPKPELPVFSRLVAWILRRYFQLLYHQLAWTYDCVAWIVSLGQWNTWVRAILPYIHNSFVIELGHGPGHLQIALNQRGTPCIGIDQSSQMGRQASRRLHLQHFKPSLINTRTQQLPFQSGSIPQIVATFPSEYITDPQSLTEIFRVLIPDGSVDILLLAWITGNRVLERLMATLFRLTGESPVWNDHFLSPARAVGFSANCEFIDLPSSRLAFIHLRKPN
jgi:ubiquinone/menaquinone biosynthesis C-methylase UbiE